MCFVKFDTINIKLIKLIKFTKKLFVFDYKVTFLSHCMLPFL